MPTQVTMPQLGETVVEGTITKWLKQEGEHIDRDEPLFEISTDKVDTEVPSPVAGTVAKILVPEGETVSVGTELAQIEEGDGQAAAPAAEEEQEAPEESAEPRTEAEEGAPEAAPAREAAEDEAAEDEAAPEPEPREQEQEPPEPGPEEREPAAVAAAPAPRAQAAERAAVEAPSAGGPRSHILSPLVRKLAEEHDLDLAQVQGTGTGGRITKRDVLAFIESGGAAAPP
nr:E3 binding domain-containing protein [Actinomycetota bacterium]